MTLCRGPVPGRAMLHQDMEQPARLLSISVWSLDTTNFSRPQMPPSFNCTDLLMSSNKKSHLKRSVFQWKLIVQKWKYPHAIINGRSLSLILAPFLQKWTPGWTMGWTVLQLLSGPDDPGFARISLPQLLLDYSRRNNLLFVKGTFSNYQ